MVTFGGAYAVLAYVAQQAVEHYGWLKPGEMLDGLGMAETTPGPADHGAAVRGLHGRVSRSRRLFRRCWRARLGGLLATWVTFTPCFLWIFLGAPVHREAARQQSAQRGLVGHHCRGGRGDPQPRHLVRDPHGLSPDRAGAGVSALVRCARPHQRRRLGACAVVAAAIAIFRFKVGMIPTLGGLLRLQALVFTSWQRSSDPECLNCGCRLELYGRCL